MKLILIAVVYLVFSGLLSLIIFPHNKHKGNVVGASGSVIGGILLIFPIIKSLLGGTETIVFNWSLPFASFNGMIDALSAFFMIPVLLLCAAGAFYGSKYMEEYFEKGKKYSFWLWYNFLEAGMIVVLISQNFIMFLIAWEIMTLASFFLVCTEHADENNRRASWIYLTAAHIGTFFIMVVFAVLGIHNGTYNFVFTPNLSLGLMVLVFISALVGFGLKAGFVPMHIWLPEAHPAAPSNVSAVMSGAMINIGLFGVLKTVILISGCNHWIGWTLLIIGLLSCIYGILFSSVQRNLKKLLAYSSVENMGIITIGLGLGILGMAYNNFFVAVLAVSGAIFHILNHSFFKGLLFMCAGNVLHETGSVDIEKLGGLMKKMPVTGLSFLIGSISICGIPPFNGFISEFLIYAAALCFVFPFGLSNTLAGLFVLIVLALSGGLAVITFTKSIGIVFLGEPRSELACEVSEVSPNMKYPPFVLAVGCIVLALISPLIIKIIQNCVCNVIGKSVVDYSYLGEINHILFVICCVFVIIITLSCLLWILKSSIMKKRVIKESPTWDCGYSKPSVKMQYTGESYVQPLSAFFSVLIRPLKKIRVPGRKLFPRRAFFESLFPDFFNRFLFEKVFGFAELIFNKLKWLQSGNVQLYILYIAITLVVLIIWELI